MDIPRVSRQMTIQVPSLVALFDLTLSSAQAARLPSDPPLICQRPRLDKNFKTTAEAIAIIYLRIELLFLTLAYVAIRVAVPRRLVTRSFESFKAQSWRYSDWMKSIFDKSKHHDFETVAVDKMYCVPRASRHPRMWARNSAAAYSVLQGSPHKICLGSICRFGASTLGLLIQGCNCPMGNCQSDMGPHPTRDTVKYSYSFESNAIPHRLPKPQHFL
ncbi:hypothetical protein FGSG_11769 [Fusarium graminearum PH-1]|uniref:hypothetical protein n=1 Tax=Gibberella zeae (strain ATCC MYA-4620 / CBS 123657 / FGSC 9075 / NRRL 31084 / PH-1) TaxID=229533 RepID=UPI00021F19CE|nr:hypothetical protein FGSG_11769 [Fusarium graminearum PH-1]ESU05655.1 hypothetical protein FGSG_11769 [Fusarium graminearum PH-1]|eukprot:XP_011316140.1 hypothetical protein FGSG_11769 [Fusarium graminearum PH-1]